MGLADLHIHSAYSWDGTSTVSALLKYAADFTSLNIISITDHNCLDGTFEAIHLGPRYGIDAIPGCEISTNEGHLLAYFISRLIPTRLSLIETLYAVNEQGGFCVAAHPAIPLKNSLSYASIRNALKDPVGSKVLVGIECYNAGVLINNGSAAAFRFAQETKKTCLGGSDTHVLETLGWGATEFPGYQVADLKRALLQKSTHVFRRGPKSGLEKMYYYLPHYILRRLGWVEDCPSPISSLRLRRTPTAKRYLLS